MCGKPRIWQVFSDFLVDVRGLLSYYPGQIPALEAETFMRFLFSALWVLLLAACASQGTAVPNLSDASNPQTVADSLRKTATANETIDVDKSSVEQLTTADTDLWARIRRGLQIPDLH